MSYKRDQKKLNKKRRKLVVKLNRRMVPTCDDWAPSYKYPDSKIKESQRDRNDPDSYEGGFVEATVIIFDDNAGKPLNYPDEYTVRVSFWGLDDTGIERYHKTKDYSDTIECYNRLNKWLSNLGLVSRNELYELGFHGA